MSRLKCRCHRKSRDSDTRSRSANTANQGDFSLVLAYNLVENLRDYASASRSYRFIGEKSIRNLLTKEKERIQETTIAHRIMYLLLLLRQTGFVLVPWNRFRAAAGISSFRSKANSIDKKGIAPSSKVASRIRTYPCVPMPQSVGYFWRHHIDTDDARATQGRRFARFMHVRMRVARVA